MDGLLGPVGFRPIAPPPGADSDRGGPWSFLTGARGFGRADEPADDGEKPAAAAETVTPTPAPRPESRVPAEFEA